MLFRSPDDMRRFGKIEKLIEKSVDKLKLPEGLGEGPKYNPKGVGPNKSFKNRRSNNQYPHKNKRRFNYGKKR